MYLPMLKGMNAKMKEKELEHWESNGFNRLNTPLLKLVCKMIW